MRTDHNKLPYSDGELTWLNFNFQVYFLKSKNDDIRVVADELIKKFKTTAGIIKAFYPFQTSDGRPLVKRRDKGCRYQYWKLIRMTEAGSLKVLKQCLLKYYEARNGGESSIQIEVHNDGDLVEL